MFAGISQFERDIIGQRTKEGLEAARVRGKVGGRKPKLDNNKRRTVYKLYQAKKMTIIEMCKMFDLTKPTLYKIVEEISKDMK